jgi:miniconductance mechanosensitive channel
MFEFVNRFFAELASALHIPESQAILFSESATFLFLVIVAIIAYYATRYFIKRTLVVFIKRSANDFDDILLKNKVISRISYFVPSLIISRFVGLTLISFPAAVLVIQKTIDVYVVLVIVMVLSAFISSLYDYYTSLDTSKGKPVKGFAQVLKLIVYVIGGLLILAIFLDKNVGSIILGLGTLSAVLMLVFKDPILGFVGGLQLSLNDMVRLGDWITMPKYNADGDVLEITLTTVKVQNFDKTITTIPTYALVSDSFTNWRGMTESGGRRVKRHITLDMETVKFCTTEMLETFKKFELVKDYIISKEKEIEHFNEVNGFDDTTLVNMRRQTNIGVFRAYLKSYLQNHAWVHQAMSILVRQLQSSERGIPMEIYFFTNIQEWASYEDIQSDVFDHIMAVLPLFGLRVFQNPSGNSIEKAVEGLKLTQKQVQTNDRKLFSKKNH